jgi:CRP-like cAMP-binding protein
MLQLEQYIHNFFQIQQTEIEKVINLFEEETLLKGQFYTKKGTYCKKMSFVRSGLIRVFAESPDKEITQWLSTDGHFITDLSSFIFKTPSRWNIQALTDCTLYTISENRYALLREKLRHWDEIEKRFIANCFLTLEDRVFRLISMTAEERYLAYFEENKAIFNEVPLHYIASMLGMTPETFSRIRKKINS